MKSILTSLLILAATPFVADARSVDLRSFRQLDDVSDLIVVGKPVSTQDTLERIPLSGVTPPVQLVGLSSEFEISAVLKGDNQLKKLVVHHYRLADPNMRILGGPMHASFEPKQPTRYLLFLQREWDGRYAPVDQMDPAWTSLLKLSGAEWNRMKPEDFNQWLDARKRLNERPALEGCLSPVIPPSDLPQGSLQEAALKGELEQARALLRAGPNRAALQAKPHGGWTPLFYAVYGGHNDLVALLLANQAEVNVKDPAGWTPLLLAVENGNTAITGLLLKSKAEVNAREAGGRTPLHVAAENGDTAMAILLLLNQADANAFDRSGDTPLHLAAARGYKEMVELLLANKAEINAEDNHNRTPLALARLHANKDVVELLRERGGLEDLKDTAKSKTWNSIGNVLFGIGLVVLFVSIAKWHERRAEHRKESVGQP